METTIKLLAIDLDGTTLGIDGELTPVVRNALQFAIKECGIVVVPCTGRVFGSMPQEMLEIPGIRYAITSNGAAVDRLPEQEAIYRNLLGQDTVLRVLKLLEQYDVMTEIFVAGKTYAERRFLSCLTDYGTAAQYVPYVLSTRTAVDDVHAVVKTAEAGIENINVKTGDSVLLERLWRELAEEKAISLTSSYPLNIEISAADTGKAQAVEWLCQQLNFTMEQVMAIGDSMNDITLLQRAGLAIAMENGIDAVKQAADFITCSNAQDGVAYAVMRFLAGAQ